MTSAPVDASTLLALATEQPEPGEGSDVPVDSTKTRKRIPDTGTPANQQGTPTQNSQNKNPTFNAPDTTAHADSTHAFPGGDPAALETLGAGSGFHTFPTGGAARTPVARARRGVLGIHPLAILVGLVALDVFIVKFAGK
jgi:hypothetical protein